MLRDGVTKAGLPTDCVVLVDDVRHEAAVELMQLDTRRLPDPARGPALIQSIRDNATVPVIIDGDGNCQVYVDASADLDRALDIVVNAKTSARACATRPSRWSSTSRWPTRSSRVCADALTELDVELVGDAGARGPLAGDGRGRPTTTSPRVPRAEVAVAVVAVARRRRSTT